MKKILLTIIPVILLAVISIITWKFGYYSFIHDNTLDDIKALNDGVMPEIEYGDDGIPTEIDGRYSDIKVHSPNDAIKSLYSIKTLMKFKDPKNEFVYNRDFEISNDHVYVFKQSYDNIIFYDKGLRIQTDKYGSIIELLSKYNTYPDLNTTPKVTEKEAQDIAEKKFGGKASEPKLVFYDVDKYEDSPVLTWEMDMGNAYKIVYVNAYNGEIVYNESTMIS